MCLPETIDDEDVDAHQDALYLRAVDLIHKTGRASISYLQRQLGINACGFQVGVVPDIQFQVFLHAIALENG